MEKLKYYKILLNNDVVDTLELDIDQYIDILPTIEKNGETIEEIEEEEYKTLNEVLDEEVDIVFTPETIYQDINLKLTLLNFYKEAGVIPSIEELDTYFRWLKGN